MQSREEKKRQTRQALKNAALKLVGAGTNFSSISLREVAKQAGVVPTSFYRHFNDMEELGLNLVDELGLLLRQLMRSARQEPMEVSGLIYRSVDTFANFVLAHPDTFWFMGQSRTGGTPALRRAIRTELAYFANELATDIRQMSLLPEISNRDLNMVCQQIVTTVADTVIDLLDLKEGNPADQQALVHETSAKVRLIWLGAQAWQSKPEN